MNAVPNGTAIINNIKMNILFIFSIIFPDQRLEPQNILNKINNEIGI